MTKTAQDTTADPTKGASTDKLESMARAILVDLEAGNLTSQAQAYAATVIREHIRRMQNTLNTYRDPRKADQMHG